MAASSFKQLEILIRKFKQNTKIYKNRSYNETQVRSEFINPFLKILGWDVENIEGKSQYLRDVLEEDTVEVESKEGRKEKKKPDYAIRLNGERKFFIEVKKPSVDIEINNNAAFQIRRYGWSAKLPVSLLTNFEKVAIYNCTEIPNSTDAFNNSRIKVFNIDELLDQDKFEEFYKMYSKNAVYSGRFDEEVEKFNNHGTESIDDYFLQQIQNWRIKIAKDILQNNNKLLIDEVDIVAQNMINKIVFLRICEDRNIEEYEGLLGLGNYDELKAYINTADVKFNSGLFESLDSYGTNKIKINDETMLSIFKELYFPSSPYAFDVIDAHILGEIYEHFLAKKLHIKNNELFLENSPEVIESNGVVTTPRVLVKNIIESAIGKKIIELSIEELQKVKICDPACGSGIFLLETYEYLTAVMLKQYSENPEEYPEYLRKNYLDEWELTFTEKRRILEENIIGVDIDYQAVEVAKFSLLLKLLEGENIHSLADYTSYSGKKILPDLSSNILWGNSLVDSNYENVNLSATEDIKNKIVMFDWEDNFEEVFKAKGGFDFIIGNPPYIRIQNMVKYAKEEVEYYQDPKSKYTCGLTRNFDKYSLFVERAISLLNPTGRLGFIIPNKFLTLQYGQALRTLIYKNKLLEELYHFGSQKVFKGKGIYTCILTLDKSSSDYFAVKDIYDLDEWKRDNQKGLEISTHNILEYEAEKQWVFLSDKLKDVFDNIMSTISTKIEDIASPFVGLQTSADRIFILKNPTNIDDKYIYITDSAKNTWKIEKDITRPMLYKQEVNLYSEPDIQTYAIFPYKSFEGNTATLYSLSDMQNQFPECLKYLNQYQSQLLTRSVDDLDATNFYKYGRTQSLTKFQNDDKIVWSVITLEPKYFIDRNNFLFTGGGNGPYYALRKNEESNDHSLEYIYAILIHPITEGFLKSGYTSYFGGGYYSHGKQFVEKLPFREIDFTDENEKQKHDQITLWVKDIIDSTCELEDGLMPREKARTKKKITQLRKNVEKEVFSLYNLNLHEQKLILNL
ncbi:Eco57I restriction-modification methylase domain-containing protein [Peribacillus butanolivorans]|uniref:Eco57I restriction-modification methylase domain-containing protein n=1 Tax=Peribacillus butanolivorans TaxID=421767 RepID=UPI0036DD36EC